MGYLIVLILAFGLIFSGALGAIPYKKWIDSAQSDITSAIFPKSEREIVIENLQKKSALIKTVLEKQAKASPGSVLPSREEIQEALKAVETSDVMLETLKAAEAEKQSVSQNIFQQVISSFSSATSPSPTPIGPECKVVCTQ